MSNLQVLRKINKLHRDIETISEPINLRLSEILDEPVFLMDQAGDGLVVVWGDSNNSAVPLHKLAKLTDMVKEDVLAVLKQYSI